LTGLPHYRITALPHYRLTGLPAYPQKALTGLTALPHYRITALPAYRITGLPAESIDPQWLEPDSLNGIHLSKTHLSTPPPQKVYYILSCVKLVLLAFSPENLG
jgi:hypothetical protein